MLLEVRVVAFRFEAAVAHALQKVLKDPLQAVVEPLAIQECKEHLLHIGVLKSELLFESLLQPVLLKFEEPTRRGYLGDLRLLDLELLLTLESYHVIHIGLPLLLELGGALAEYLGFHFVDVVVLPDLVDAVDYLGHKELACKD